MGKKNNVTKKYIENNETFADIFNYFIYNGNKIISPTDLREKDPTELLAFISDEDVSYTKEKLRDVLKKCVLKETSNCMYLILGIEAQSEVHYAMPVRNGLYDFIDYASQVQKIAKKHGDIKDVRGKLA